MYTDDEKRWLEELFFHTKSLKWPILNFLDAHKNDPSDARLNSFKTFLHSELSSKVKNPTYKCLLSVERVTAKENGEFFESVLARLVSGGGPAQSAQSSQSAQSARPAVPVAQLPDALDRYPGFPLEPIYARQAADTLNLDERDARKALQPVELKLCHMRTDRGGELVLYHQTLKTDGSQGAKDSRGGYHITYFYCLEGGAFYLVAWGMHVGNGSETYRILRPVPTGPYAGLKNAIVTFS